jgi:mono/diheme cytochrome c family protein
MTATPPARAALATASMLMLILILGACGGGDDASSGSSSPDPSNQPAASGTANGELSATELAQGIGPVRDLRLDAVDPELAAAGEVAFMTKCSACHRLADRYVAPELGTVLARRRPEFVMNMILNANEMVERHPVVRELLAQYYTPMPVQVTDRDEARAILEYLRSAQTDPSTSLPDTTSAEAGGS